MVGSVENEKIQALPEDFVTTTVDDEVEKKREISLGRNVHTTCHEVSEPDDDDDSTGDREAYMASVLARYRKSLIERTKHHLGICNLCTLFS